MEGKKRRGRSAKGITVLCLILCMLAGILSVRIEVGAAAAKGIAGNGTGGISININEAPYTTFSGYDYGQNAYTSVGCAWFASARVKQLTGKGSTIRAGTNWWRNAASVGYSRGSEIKAPGILCFEGHVSIAEKIEGDTVYISEGGSGYTDASHGYCIIRKMSKSDIQAGKGGTGSYLGCVYLPGASPGPGAAVQSPSIKACTSRDEMNASGDKVLSWQTETNWGTFGRISNPNGAVIGEVGMYLYDANGRQIGFKNETYLTSANKQTTGYIFYDINAELGVTLQPGTLYRYKLYAYVGGKYVDTGLAEFTTKGTAPLSVPPVPQLSVPKADYGRNEEIPISWQQYADGTDVMLIVEGINGTDYYVGFTADRDAVEAGAVWSLSGAGEYRIKAMASNRAGLSDMAVLDTVIRVHPDVTVSFWGIGGNGEEVLIEEQAVAWSQSAELPEAPAREGYVFVGWSGSYEKVTQDAKVTAVYEQKAEEPKPGDGETEQPGKEHIFGDGDGNGKVDLADVQLTLRAALKICTLTAEQEKAVDMDKNQKIDLNDARRLLSRVLLQQ